MTGTNSYNSEYFPTLTSRKTSSGKLTFRLASAAAVCGIILATFYIMASSRNTMSSLSSSSSDTALFDDAGRYVMRNYDDIKPNSNFLAGLGGIWGVPMVRFNFSSIIYFSLVTFSRKTKFGIRIFSGHFT